ncbi:MULTISPECIES: LacI family DNA-binding transcriptional regulator [unclassified Microbacterium]|uniref:LacI family DNA-binding transcriptional regulator n=1 Tax=unclassified Microbacterium TaxID=2609290 RepID=UPI00214B0ED9|nr:MULTISPECIES: LacI family DNA-binding transcriptional regulator [unclassified Microbacterium]MCR2784331.1 LacI family transcriptional regulator [Microbacterium sp. zg.B96]WIM14843.1 LacI family DNA-binding transcriptional regulator [Microbacterium sp. zg-B96]
MSTIVTIHDVAREAAVSPATVSNAMNRPGRVAADTRARVLAVADRLGYIPHAVAAHRARTATSRVGIIAPFTTYASFAARIQGALTVLSADNLEAIVYDHPSASRSPSPRLASLPFSGNLDGLVIMGVPIDTGIADRLLARGLATVLVDSRHPQFTSVVLDEERGATLAAEHLIGRGFEQFVYVTEGQRSKDYVSQGKRRLTGFVNALRERGVAESAIHCITAPSGNAKAGQAAAEHVALLSREGRVGVLCGHDTLAAGVLSGLRGRGVAVPDRVGVIGWDGGEVVEALGLTTVRQPLVESGRAGAERLVALLHNPTAPVERVVLAPVLAEGITS